MGKKTDRPWVCSLVAPPSILGPFKQLPSPVLKDRVAVLFFGSMAMKLRADIFK